MYFQNQKKKKKEKKVIQFLATYQSYVISTIDKLIIHGYRNT